MGKSIKQFLKLDSYDRDKFGKEMTHNEKYEKIVKCIGFEKVCAYLPATKEEIQKALMEDIYLNNIRYKKWVDLHENFKYEFLRIGITTISISDTVCTLKTCARMLAEKE